MTKPKEFTVNGFKLNAIRQGARSTEDRLDELENHLITLTVMLSMLMSDEQQHAARLISADIIRNKHKE